MSIEKMQEISVIILTYNEELHIERAILNAKKFASKIYVIDSYSTDRTVEIAKSLGTNVYQRAFLYQAEQFNWGLDNLPINTEWIFRIDADEYLSDELIEEVKTTIANSKPDDGINGYTVHRKMMFLGKHIKHGIVPMIILRLFRKGHARVEDKMMDEHLMLTDGVVHELKYPLFDDNKKGLTAWTQKHNGYSTREAIDLLCTEYNIGNDNAINNTGAHSKKVRKQKLRYAKLPLFWRAFAFFIFRYIFRLGFIDGKEGFLWHFLQGFWYRALADAKVYEIKKQHNFDKDKIKQFVTQYLKDHN